jgi:pimeloyl-CoA synthetase
MTTAVTGSSSVAGVDRSQMNLGDLIMLIQSERAELLESQLQDQVKQMQYINAKIKEANDWLAQARSLKEQATDKKCSEEPQAMRDWADANGINMSDVNNDKLHTKSEWEGPIASIKAHIDGLNSSSQMEMIRLQSLMNKRNQAFEMMTNALNKISGSMDKVIGNIR